MHFLCGGMGKYSFGSFPDDCFVSSGIIFPTGEVPSKLESLMSMSGELTTSAIENGRWHHAAATRALEDQLASGTFRQLPNHKSFGNLHQSSLPFML